MKFRKTNKTIWGIFLGRNYTPLEHLHIRKWLSVWTLIRLSMLIIFQWLFTCSKSILETLEQGVNVRSGAFIVNFDQTSHRVLVLLSLTLRRLIAIGSVFWNHFLMTQVRGILWPWNFPSISRYFLTPFLTSAHTTWNSFLVCSLLICQQLSSFNNFTPISKSWENRGSYTPATHNIRNRCTQ